MSAREIIKVAGVAVAAAILGQLPAHAAIDLSTGAGSVTYARETLTTANVVDVDGVTYYEVTAPASGDDVDRLSLMAPLGRDIQETQVVQVQFLLSDMVFAGTLLGDGALTISGVAPARIEHVEGGDEDDDNVIFRVTTGSTETIDRTAIMTLKPSALAVLPGKAGGAKVRTRPPGETSGSWTDGVEATGIVKVASALKESAIPTLAVVKFDDDFRTFSGGALAASVGKITIAVNEGLRIAAGSSSVTEVTSVLLSTGAGKVGFSAADPTDVDFIEDAFLSAEEDCTSTGADKVDVFTTAFLTTTTGPNLVDANDKYLCIEANGTTSIPETGAYKATIDYVPIASAAFEPGDVELELGQVVREGTTVNLPFVNTNPRFLFRIVITNRGERAAPYRFDFVAPADDGGARSIFRRGPKGMGTLPARSVTLLNAREVAVREGGTGRRTATGAILTVNAPSDNIDVMTMVVNLMDDLSTDSVKWK